VLSNYVTSRDSNRGGCAQICRFVFDNNLENNFTMSSKDLNMIDYICDMMDLGVESYKVEGRMKSLYYIATIANAYRTIIDKKIDGTINDDVIKYYKKVLERCSNRENIPQFYNGNPGTLGEYFTGRNEISNQDFLGLIIDYDNDTNIAVVEQRNKFNVNDEVEIFGPNTLPKTFKINEIIDNNGVSVDSACHAQEIVKIKIPFKVQKDDIIRVKVS